MAKILRISALIAVLFSSCKQWQPFPQIDQTFLEIDLGKLNSSDTSHKLADLETVSSSIDDDSLRASTFLKIGNRYWNIGDYQNFWRLNYHLTQLRYLSPRIESKAMLNLGDYYFKFEKWDSAYYYNKNAENVLRFSGISNPDLARAIVNNGQIFYNLGEFFLAEKSAFACLNICLSSEYDDQKYAAYNLLGNVNMEFGNFGKSIGYHRKALALNNYGKFKSPFFFKEATLFNIGLVYHYAKKDSLAIKYFIKALKNEKLKKDYPALYANIIDGIAYSNLRLYRTPAKDSFFEALKINDSLGANERATLNLEHIATSYLMAHDTTNAAIYYEKALVKAKNTSSSFTIQRIVKEILNTQQSGDKYNTRYISMLDLLRQREFRSRDRFSRIEFQIHDAFLKRQHFQSTKRIGFWISLLIFSSIGTILIWFHQRHRRLKMKLTAEQSKADEKVYHIMLDHFNRLHEVKIVERRTVARELHDNIMNKLASTRFGLFAMAKVAEESIAEICVAHMNGLQSIEEEIRCLATNLFENNPIFDGNFETVLSEFVQKELMGFEIDHDIFFDVAILWANISHKVKVHLFRIIQESLANCLKHSSCKSIRISFLRQTNSILLEIKDDGIGFDPVSKNRGMGLENINDRVKDFDGVLRIEAANARGTIIKINFPYETN